MVPILEALVLATQSSSGQLQEAILATRVPIIQIATAVFAQTMFAVKAVVEPEAQIVRLVVLPRVVATTGDVKP